MTDMNFYDWNTFKQAPGLSTSLAGGLPMDKYDPKSQTAGTMDTFNQILGGQYDQKLTKPGKYAAPMRENVRMGANRAKSSAISKLKSSQGAGYDPTSEAMMDSMFDVTAAQKEPEIGIASGQMATAENAPKIAANSMLKQSAAQGLSSLSAVNANNEAAAMQLKYSTQNAALNAALAAVTNMMSSYGGFMMNMMPNVTQGAPRAGTGQWSGKVPQGNDPWSFWQGGGGGKGFGSGGPNY